MLNEFDIAKDRTQNFKDHRLIMQDVSIVSIERVYSYIHKLMQLIPQDNEVLDDLDIIIKPLEDVIDKLFVDKACPHCGGYVFKSDIPQYDYVCVDCDENF